MPDFVRITDNKMARNLEKKMLEIEEITRDSDSFGQNDRKSPSSVQTKKRRLDEVRGFHRTSRGPCQLCRQTNTKGQGLCRLN